MSGYPSTADWGGRIPDQCRICGKNHDRHEDADCGCGCGSEPMGCPECIREGGPETAAERSRWGDRNWRPEMADDASDFDDEG